MTTSGGDGLGYPVTFQFLSTPEGVGGFYCNIIFASEEERTDWCERVWTSQAPALLAEVEARLGLPGLGKHVGLIRWAPSPQEILANLEPKFEFLPSDPEVIISVFEQYLQAHLTDGA